MTLYAITNMHAMDLRDSLIYFIDKTQPCSAERIIVYSP